MDEFGRKRSCGLIPSKYNAQCELMKQHLNNNQNSQTNLNLNNQTRGGGSSSKWYRFKFFNFPSLRILFWKGVNKGTGSGRRDSRGYAKLTDDCADSQLEKDSPEEGETRILASAVVPSYSPLLNNGKNDQNDEIKPCSSTENALKSEPKTKPEVDSTREIVQSYKLVKMLPLQGTPRPVLIYGPFSHIIAARLEAAFPDLFRVCSRKDVTTALTMSPSSLSEASSNLSCDRNWEFTSSTTTEDTLKCIALGDIEDIAADGRHPVLSVTANTIADFRRASLYPIVVGLRFRSAKHLKETVNRWSHQQQQNQQNQSQNPLFLQLGPRAVVGYKLAKTSYAHQLKLEQAFAGAATDVRIAGNNIAFMCTQIKDRVCEQQNKVVWKDADQQS